MINILVTGSKGQLGKELQKISDMWSFQFFYTDIEELDLRDRKAVIEYFNHNNINVCINCAAYTAVDKAESEIELAMDINATAVKNLALACSEQNAVLIHISTDYVFDGQNCVPYLEDDRPKPINVYGRSKLEGEIMADKIHDKSIIIRTSWLYSMHGVNFLKTMLRLGKEKQNLEVVFDQIGSPTYAGDLAQAILQLIKVVLDNQFNPSYFGTYHYTNEGIASWYDFAYEIFRIRNISTTIEPVNSLRFPTPAKRPSYSVLDKSKIKSTFNITIPHWKDSLSKCLDNISESPI